MTRKDYIVIASALRDAYQKEEMDNKYAPEGEPDSHQHSSLGDSFMLHSSCASR